MHVDALEHALEQSLLALPLADWAGKLHLACIPPPREEIDFGLLGLGNRRVLSDQLADGSSHHGYSPNGFLITGC